MMRMMAPVPSMFDHIALNAVIGLSSAISRAIDDTMMATAAANRGARIWPRRRRFTGAASCRGPGHVRAELDRGDRRWVDLGHDPPAQHHEQPVGETDQLLEVGRDEQRGQP